MPVPVRARSTSWWTNLIIHARTQCDRPLPDGSAADFIVINDDILALHNGRDLDGTEYVEFDTEEDAAAFILQWG